jgi:hypothetical protein
MFDYCQPMITHDSLSADFQWDPLQVIFLSGYLRSIINAQELLKYQK